MIKKGWFQESKLINIQMSIKTKQNKLIDTENRVVFAKLGDGKNRWRESKGKKKKKYWKNISLIHCINLKNKKHYLRKSIGQNSAYIHIFQYCHIL